MSASHINESLAHFRTYMAYRLLFPDDVGLAGIVHLLQEGSLVLKVILFAFVNVPAAVRIEHEAPIQSDPKDFLQFFEPTAE